MARFDVDSSVSISSVLDSGMPDALLELGLMYSAGRGVELDLVEAHKWFNIAAARGNEAARRYRSELSNELSRRQISEAQRRARAWMARG